MLCAIPSRSRQKEIALGTEPAALQRTPVRYSGSSSPGTHDSTPTDAGTRDMTHGVTTNKGPHTSTNEVTRRVETGTDNVDDRDGDVVMNRAHLGRKSEQVSVNSEARDIKRRQ